MTESTYFVEVQNPSTKEYAVSYGKIPNMTDLRYTPSLRNILEGLGSAVTRHVLARFAGSGLRRVRHKASFQPRLRGFEGSVQLFKESVYHMAVSENRGYLILGSF